jgi:hypothetical protein
MTECAPLLVLDLGLDIVDGVRRLHLKGDGLARKGLDENLHGGRWWSVRSRGEIRTRVYPVQWEAHDHVVYVPLLPLFSLATLSDL